MMSNRDDGRLTALVKRDIHRLYNKNSQLDTVNEARVDNAIRSLFPVSNRLV